MRCREQKVEDLTQQTRSARSRASSAKENQRSYVTELVCAEEKLSVKKESLRVLQEKRQQLTDELAELQNAEADTRKQLNLCRSNLSLELACLIPMAVQPSTARQWWLAVPALSRGMVADQ